ncbi:ABC transporter permease [Sinobaca sp. H24]|uniref:ABC transporter permease n=1 Tax=Sinobaca sp. H24 TaxID=2923376 RepID=UPI00207A663E|nr:ABC transporter permease [Sinobaca sp. H24]
MNNFWITVAHTMTKRIRSKSFFWSSLVTIILVVGLMNAAGILSSFSDDEAGEASNVAVIDNTSEDEEMGAALASYEESSFAYENYSGTEEEALSAAEEEEYAFVLTLEGEPAELDAVLYGSESDFQDGQVINQDVQRIKEGFVTNELNLDEQQLATIYEPVSFSEQPLTEGAEVQTEEAHNQAYWMVYALVFAIYLLVIMFGSMIATEVATEKSSRVMELIVSSVNPITQMFGKLVGIGIVGLLNVVVLAAAALIGDAISGDNILEGLFSETIEISLLLYALLFIVLGYFLYGGIAAMLGALVSRAEEVNQAIQPLIYVAMVAFFIAIFGLNAPDATIIQILSYIPFFTPQLLFLRIGMTSVPVWEIILIIAILTASAFLINMLAARIYKGGVLMYGKFSIKNGMKQAFTISKKEK